MPKTGADETGLKRCYNESPDRELPTKPKKPKTMTGNRDHFPPPASNQPAPPGPRRDQQPGEDEVQLGDVLYTSPGSQNSESPPVSPKSTRGDLQAPDSTTPAANVDASFLCSGSQPTATSTEPNSWTYSHQPYNFEEGALPVAFHDQQHFNAIPLAHLANLQPQFTDLPDTSFPGWDQMDLHQAQMQMQGPPVKNPELRMLGLPSDAPVLTHSVPTTSVPLKTRPYQVPILTCP